MTILGNGGQVLIGTTTGNTSDRFTIVDPGNAFMSLRSETEADGHSQVIDFAVGTSDRSSSNLVSSITAAIPTGAGAGGTLKGYLAFSTNSGDSLSERVRIDETGTLSIKNSTYLSNSSTITSRITLNSENTSIWTGTRELVAFDLIGNGADHRTGTLSIKCKKASGDTAPTEMLRIDGVYDQILLSTAKVGIGTTSPGNPLHVRSTITDLLKLDCNDNGNLGAHLQLNHDSASPADDDVVGAIEFSGKDSNGNATIYSRIRGVAIDVTDGTEDGALVFGTRENASFGERMRISGANVYIGTTTSHAGKFIVKDTDNSGNQIWVIGRTNGDTGSISFRNNADDAYTGRIQASTANGMEFNSAGSTRGSFDTSGDFIINDGNLKILTAGHGIDFSVTSDAPISPSSELFDDYEEGTWAPTLHDSSGNNSSFATVTNANYTRIGDTVRLSMRAVNMLTAGMVSGNAVYVKGLPYSTSQYNYGTAWIRGFSDSVWTPDACLVFAICDTNQIFFQGDTGGTGGAAFTWGDVVNNQTDCWFTIIYKTS